MTEHKHLKRRVRDRMARTGERYAAARAHVVAAAEPAAAEPATTEPATAEPATAAADAAGTPSDDAVARATGRGREAWFALLDAHGATALDHTSIARWLREEHGVSSWWSQSITVQYERARGLRAKHEKADGFEVGATRTIALPAAALFAAVHERLTAETIAVRTATPPRTARYDLPVGRLHLTIVPKGEDRAMASLVHARLPDEAAAAEQKARWRGWLAAAKEELERG